MLNPGVWLIAFILSLAILALANRDCQDDFTDTGVGCIDDCLEPEIQDEAQTATSQQKENR